ncbi:MAG: divalent metal cation transporter [Opitutales bacterium]
MSNKTNTIEEQRAQILQAKKEGKLSMLKTFTKFSGPGWLQSATTLGGGSLASALYLGVLGGFGLMWLQPMAMILGIIMLAAISYVTLSIKDKPIEAINREISPILGYAWAGGSMFACLVFAMPQFALTIAGVTQNLGIGSVNGEVAKSTEVIITFSFFALAVFLVYLYAKGGKALKFFEWIIKLSVASIVVCFFGVVLSLSLSGDIQWSRVFSGFMPNFSLLNSPAEDFVSHLNALGEAGKEFWTNLIVSQQRDVIISAAAMAVGINMTFLFPYSMLKKGWNKDFRELAIFDLATGLFIPFLLGTSCIVIAAASQFNAKPAEGLITSTIIENKLVAQEIDGVKIEPAKNLIDGYVGLLNTRVAKEKGISLEEFKALPNSEKDALRNGLSQEEKTMAAMLVKRDASNLSVTLEPLLGKEVARYVFGFGVVGMAVNAMLMNMLICGLCFSVIIGKFGIPKWQLIGSLLVGFSALTSLFVASEAKMWLIINAGVMAMIFLPIAYGAFLAIMNTKSIMGESMPKGKARLAWNVLMTISLIASIGASAWVLHTKAGVAGPVLLGVFALIVIIDAKFKIVNRIFKR